MRYLLINALMLGGLAAIGQPADGYLQAMRERLTNAKLYSLNVAKAMPEKQYGFKPAESEMRFGEQLLHMAGNLEMICTRYLGAEKPAYEISRADTSMAYVCQRLANAFDLAIATITTLQPGQLNDTVPFFAGPKTKLQMVNLLNDHQAHHRGQLIVYLRLMGIKPPAYVGW